MHIYPNLNSFRHAPRHETLGRPSHHDAVLVIGNFDGVHKGHCQLIAHARNLADKTGRPLGVLTFEPHPRSLFRPDEPSFRLTPYDIKMERLKQTGLDFVVTLDFDWDFASQTTDQFMDLVLRQTLAPHHIFIGYDFRFGQMRKGHGKDLRDAGFHVTIIDEILDEDQTGYSSSRIRSHLRHGEMAQANALLGWDWEIRGTVRHGDGRGRDIGYPTANIDLGQTIHPAYGIYAAWVQIENAPAQYMAAVNIGIRPMFELREGQLEAHILDYNQDLYGKNLHVRPINFIRGEAKFDTLEDLVRQIDDDCQTTRRILRDTSLT